MIYINMVMRYVGKSKGVSANTAQYPATCDIAQGNMF